MHILSPEARAAAEAKRFQSALENFSNYELQRQGTSEVFVVRGGSMPYTTTPTHCSCPDHCYRGVACRHIQLVRARIVADGNVVRSEKAAKALADRELWG